MSTADLAFVHRFRPPDTENAPVLLLLHGTGGNEADLLDLGDSLWPGAGLLSPRGKVLEQGMPRFFRRLAEGVFDLDDLRRRAAELDEFARGALARHSLQSSRLVAVGFSNGANIAAAVLLLHPGTLSAAVLFRAMVPLVPDPLPRLPGTPVLLSSGRSDPLVQIEESKRLASLLERAGADVTIRWQEAGHGLVANDVSNAHTWLREVVR